ncbi:MAG TPA: hypothetical protein DC000_12850 [Clostridiales bacterium]|nr:hypothetical protein [Clostridiales bacterium]
MKKILGLILLVLVMVLGYIVYNESVDKEKTSYIIDFENSEDGNNKDMEDSKQTNTDNSEKTDTNENLNTSDKIIDNKNIMEIREKMFIAQIEDIYYNIEDFKDKYIKIEGMYSVVEPEEGDIGKVHFVYRNAPGCCGNDGWAGFMLNYDGEYPNTNDWIQVVGTPEIVKNGVYEDLYLNVISIEVMEERGAEFVNQ